MVSVSLRRIIISNNYHSIINNQSVCTFPSPYGESSFQIIERFFVSNVFQLFPSPYGESSFQIRKLFVVISEVVSFRLLTENHHFKSYPSHPSIYKASRSILRGKTYLPKSLFIIFSKTLRKASKYKVRGKINQFQICKDPFPAVFLYSVYISEYAEIRHTADLWHAYALQEHLSVQIFSLSPQYFHAH